MATRIFLVGVGGQGSLSASKIIGNAAMQAGQHALVGEIHGMAQRGGVVESTVVISEDASPMIADGQADVLFGFEPLETLRAIRKVSKRTLVITNTARIVPFTVSTGSAVYPDLKQILETLETSAGELIALDAEKLAKDAGDIIAVNSVLLGVLAASGRLPFPQKILLDSLLETVPDRFSEMNRRAFDLGFNYKTSTDGE